MGCFPCGAQGVEVILRRLRTAGSEDLCAARRPSYRGVLPAIRADRRLVLLRKSPVRSARGPTGEGGDLRFAESSGGNAFARFHTRAKEQLLCRTGRFYPTVCNATFSSQYKIPPRSPLECDAYSSFSLARASLGFALVVEIALAKPDA